MKCLNNQKYARVVTKNLFSAYKLRCIKLLRVLQNSFTQSFRTKIVLSPYNSDILHSDYITIDFENTNSS